MSTELRLRPMTTADAPAYYEHMLRHFRESGKEGDPIFHPVTGWDSWNREEQLEKLTRDLILPLPQVGWQRIWIAEDANGLVRADCLLRSGFMDATAHRCQYAIGVERSARGRGVGEELSHLALAWAREQKELEWIDLWVFAHNRPAISLYEKLGFRKLDTVVDQFRVDGKKIDDMHMHMKLRD